MWPVLRDGDSVGFRPLSRSPDEGAVLVVRGAERLVVHRVARLAGRQVVLRGDACAGEDAPVGLDQILGQVEVVERCGVRLSAQAWDRPPGRLGRRIFGVLRRLAARGYR